MKLHVFGTMPDREPFYNNMNGNIQAAWEEYGNIANAQWSIHGCYPMIINAHYVHMQTENCLVSSLITWNR